MRYLTVTGVRSCALPIYRRLTAAAPSGRAVDVIWVAGPAVERVPAVAAHAAWRAVRLADQDRARTPHPGDYGGVAGGDVGAQHAQPGGGRQPGGVGDVPGRERDAMQRAEDALASVVAVG